MSERACSRARRPVSRSEVLSADDCDSAQRYCGIALQPRTLVTPGPARAAALVQALGPKSINPSGPRKHLTEKSVVDSFSDGLDK